MNELKVGDSVVLIDPQPAWFATTATIRLQSLDWPRKITKVNGMFCEIDDYNGELRIDRFILSNGSQS